MSRLLSYIDSTTFSAIIEEKINKKNNIIIDSKSGFSGAGKNLKKKFSHKNLFSSIQVYGLPKHRHISEIDQEINKTIRSRVKYVFTPHLLPTFRGLLSAIYVEKNKGITVKKIHSELNQFYKKSFFIKIAALNKTIGTGNVINTNFCEISVCSLREKSKILILSAIDNLIKGAGGQAVQNMNLIFGYKENLGLR